MPINPIALDSSQSVYREKIIEHSLATKFLVHDWQAGEALIDILKPEIDRFGYDLMIIRGATSRFLQIKSSTIGSPVASHKVHVNLLNKADGCVIWAVVDQNLGFDSFRVIIPPLGTAIGEQGFKVATHNKRNSQGVKTERPNIREIPKARFKKIETFKEVFDLLFPSPG